MSLTWVLIDKNDEMSLGIFQDSTHKKTYVRKKKSTGRLEFRPKNDANAGSLRAASLVSICLDGEVTAVRRCPLANDTETPESVIPGTKILAIPVKTTIAMVCSQSEWHLLRY